MKIGQDQESFLAGILLTLAAGILLGPGWQVPIQGPTAGAFLLCLIAGWACWRGKAWTWIVFLGLFVCLGMLRFLSAAALPAGKQGGHLEPKETESFRRWTVRVRQHYRQAMEAVMPKADAAAIFAMLFGGYDGIHPELLEAFTTTGINTI